MPESLRDKSRENWGNDDNSDEKIQLGCLLRIADATEAMAKRQTELIDERDRAKRSAQYWEQIANQRLMSNRSLKGQITKLRKQLIEARQRREDGHG